MAWMRAVCGRLGNGYRYSKEIVYNSFPWCSPTQEQKKKIDYTAQAILDARALYSDCSLAELYDDTVMLAYGFDIKSMTESACVAELMKMYQKLTEKV